MGSQHFPLQGFQRGAGVTGDGGDGEKPSVLSLLNTRVLGDRMLQLASIFVFSGGQRIF